MITPIEKSIMQRCADDIRGFEIQYDYADERYSWTYGDIDSDYQEYGEDGFVSAFDALIHFTAYIAKENREYCSLLNGCKQDSFECSCKEEGISND
ncbi:hypothetical protein [Nostoc sp.]|uniref:hypothetical protein n=1 Tax=Nostoc sp. TaxID=1180 RepID=UPI002FEF2E8F